MTSETTMARDTTMARETTIVAVAHWPDPDVVTPPRPLPGFIASSFSPLVADVADRCLRAVHGEPPLPGPVGERTAVVLASVRGDLTIAAEIARTVDSGRRMSPLLFFQSVSTAVLGHVAARWGLCGPVLCVSPVDDPEADALALAAALIEAGDADAALVLVAEPAWLAGEGDRASAMLVRRAGEGQDRQPDEGDRRGDH